MSIITIGKKKFKGVYRWDDITLKQFCDLAAIPVPDGFEKFVIADGMVTSETIDSYVDIVSSLTDKQVNEEFPDYYRKVILCLSNIPRELLTPELTHDLYNCYFRPFVLTLFYHAPVIYFMGQIKDYEPENVGRIRLGLSYYHAPASVKILDQEIPLSDEPCISYVDASDVFGGMKLGRDDIKRLALFMAIYCRKKGEAYDEKKALERQSLFMEAPMSKVWAVFFYTIRRINSLEDAIQLFGSLPKSLTEIVTRVKVYKNLVTGS